WGCRGSASRLSKPSSLKARTVGLNVRLPLSQSRIVKEESPMSVHAQAKDRPAPARFQWDDAFLLDDQLTEDERLIRDTARAYAHDRLLPRSTEAYLHETPDRTLFTEMGELGLIGVTVPEQYGCAGASYVAYGLVAREIERVDSGYRSMN